MKKRVQLIVVGIKGLFSKRGNLNVKLCYLIVKVLEYNGILVINNILKFS